MTRVRLALAVLVVAAAVIVVVVVVPKPATSCSGQSCGDHLDTTATGWILPSLTGPGTVSLRQFRGHPLVADFFASWCTACRDELPDFLTVSRQRTAVRFVGIDSEEYGDGTALARQSGITAWPLARDVGGSDSDGLHEALTPEQGMPITAFYDADGRVVGVQIGAETGGELNAQLSRYFGAAA